MKNFIRKAVGKLHRLSSLYCRKTTIRIPRDFKAVSFCFDDFPVTALKGAEELEKAGARGTFYICFSLLGKDSPSGKIVSLDHVLTLANRGHEIGCHTYDHLNCSYNPTALIRESCERNHVYAKEQGINLENFSYPQGGMRLGVKKYLQHQYKSARTVMPGINSGKTDLHALKANSLYEHSDLDAILKMIEDVKNQGGWLILYTHDISDEKPSQYGVSQKVFDQVLAHCREQALPIKTVDDVLRGLGR